MLTLILNNTDGFLQIGIGTEDDLVYASHISLSSNGTEYLVPCLFEAFSKINYSQKDITHIACVVGPGSFTGIRLILTTALGIAKSLHAKLGALHYLESLAFSAYNPSCSYWVMTYARKNLLYLQKYYCNTEELSVKEESEILTFSPEETTEYIKQNMSEQSYLLGKGAYLYKDFFNKNLPTIHILPEHTAIPNMMALYSLSKKISYSTTALTPLYVRKSDAEENLHTIAKKLGYSNDEIEAYYKNNK